MLMMLKTLIKQFLRSQNLELCRISPDDQRAAVKKGWEKLPYKDLQIARAIASEGHISIDEAKFLSSLVRRTSKEDPIIEIGTLFGFSTNIIAISKEKSQTLITVDKYVWNSLRISPAAHKLGTYAALQDAVKNHNVEVVDQDKDIFYENYTGPPPGLFFCDANHAYEATLRDLTWARKVGAKIVCGHDYDLGKYPGVVQAVDAFGGPREVVETLFVL
jgi:hypothetical protein